MADAMTQAFAANNVYQFCATTARLRTRLRIPLLASVTASATSVTAAEAAIVGIIPSLIA